MATLWMRADGVPKTVLLERVRRIKLLRCLNFNLEEQAFVTIGNNGVRGGIPYEHFFFLSPRCVLTLEVRTAWLVIAILVCGDLNVVRLGNLSKGKVGWRIKIPLMNRF